MRGSRRGQGRDGSSRRTGLLASAFAMLLLVAPLVAACEVTGQLATPMLGPMVVAEIERSIEIREQLGLRADRAWVETVLADDASVLRLEILVSPEEAAQIDQRALRQAIQLREAAGLPADEAFVQALLADASTVERMGIPLTPDEATAWDARLSNMREVGPALRSYGKKHPDEWAGQYLGEDGQMVALVSGHLEEHRVAIAALFVPGSVRVEVREVRWSSRELRAFNKQVKSARMWFTKHDIDLTGIGPEVKENRVGIEVETLEPRPGIEQFIIDHFDGADWLFVEASVNWAASLPFGTLTVTVIDAAGRPLPDVICWLKSDIPGATGNHTIRDANKNGVCRWDKPDSVVRATSFAVEVWTDINGNLLGSGEVTVPANSEGRLTIQIAGD